MNKKKILTGILTLSLLIAEMVTFTLTVRAEPDESEIPIDNEISDSESIPDEPMTEPDTEIPPVESISDEPVFDPQPDPEPQPEFPIEIPFEPEPEYSYIQQESSEITNEPSSEFDSDPFYWAHDYDTNSSTEYNYYDYRYVEESSSYDYSYGYYDNNSYVAYESYTEPYYNDYDDYGYYGETSQPETTQTEEEQSSFVPQETSVDNSELTSKDWENLRKHLDSSLTISNGKNESGDETIRRIKEDSDYANQANDDVGYLIWGIVLIVAGAAAVAGMIWFNLYVKKHTAAESVSQPLNDDRTHISSDDTVEPTDKVSDDDPYGDDY